MKAGSFHDSPLDEREGENDPMHDPLWRLLAQSPRPEPDAWFAVRTLARCRNEGLGTDSTSWLPRMAGLWHWALGGGLALCLALAFVMTQVQTETADKQKNVQEASSSSPWQDTSL
jgi:hypothetical protein